MNIRHFRFFPELTLSNSKSYTFIYIDLDKVKIIFSFM